MNGVVEIQPAEQPAFPDCIVEGCGFQSYNKDRHMDHLTDDHELWEKLFTSEVRIR